jgi:hypothetical protein
MMIQELFFDRSKRLALAVLMAAGLAATLGYSRPTEASCSCYYSAAFYDCGNPWSGGANCTDVNAGIMRPCGLGGGGNQGYQTTEYLCLGCENENFVLVDYPTSSCECNSSGSCY